MTDRRRQTTDPVSGERHADHATPDGEALPPDELLPERETVRGEEVLPDEQIGPGVLHDDRAASPAQVEDTPGVDLEEAAATDPRTKAEVLGELLAAEAKRDEYLEDLRRSHADFENYRKRVLREGATQRSAGKATVVEALLDVLDDLDRTVAAAADSPDEGLARGVQLVADKLVKALEQVGLERIETTEVRFDPSVHEAVQQQPADPPREEPVVVEVLRPGYRLQDRTLRAAMVVVEQ